jgi:hypothetical protein
VRCAKYRAANSEKCKEICAKRRETHREEARVVTAKWRSENPERAKSTVAAYRKKHSDKARMRTAQWQKDNPERCTAHSTKRRATKLNAVPKWFGELDELIIEEAVNLRKLRENMTGFKWHVDHAVPLQSKKVCGFHIGCNIQVIPASINQSKSNQHWPDMA